MTRYLLIGGILLMASFLRFYQLSSTPPGFYFDEAMDGNNAVEVAQTNHFQSFYVEDNGREGLYVNILALLFKASPVREPWIVRLPAAVAGVLTVWGLYALVAELFGDATGLLAAFLLATSFWHIDFSRTAVRAVLAPLALTWSLYLLIKAYRSLSASWALGYSIAAGAVFGLGFYTYIAYRIMPVLFLLFIPFFRQTTGFWKRTAAFVFTALVVAAPLGWYFLRHPADFSGRTSQVSVMNASRPLLRFAINLVKHALFFNVRGDGNWRHNMSGAPQLFWPVGMLLVLGVVLGIYALWVQWGNRSKAGKLIHIFPVFGTFLTFATLILATIPAAASNEGIPHALRFILAATPAMTLAALGGVWLYGTIERRGSRQLARLIAVLFLASVAVQSYFYYFQVWAKNPNVADAFKVDYVTIGRQINALPAATPKYVVVVAPGVIVRGIPMPAQTTMFITNSFTDAGQRERNIHYLLPEQIDQIPPGTPSGQVFYLTARGQW